MQYHITRSELEILQMLWCANTSLSRSGILERSENKTWKDNSIHILLNGLLRKGLIKEDGFARSGKVWGRLYAPALSAEEFYSDLFDSGPNPSAAEMLAYYLSRENVSAAELEELQALISTYQSEHSNKERKA